MGMFDMNIWNISQCLQVNIVEAIRSSLKLLLKEVIAITLDCISNALVGCNHYGYWRHALIRRCDWDQVFVRGI